MKFAPKYIALNISIFAVVVFRKLSSFLPTRLATSLGRRAGFLAMHFVKREVRIATAQIQFASITAPSDSPLYNNGNPLSMQDAHKILRNTFGHVGESIAETMIIERYLASYHAREASPEGEYLHVEGLEVLEEVTRLGKSTVALSGHLGCFELIAAFVADRAPLSVVGRLPKYPVLAKMLTELRERQHISTIWREDNRAGSKIRQAMKKKSVIGFLIDQDLNLENIFYPFFGLQAAVPLSPLRLAVRYKLPIMTTFIVRMRPLQHKLIFRWIPYDPEDPEVYTNILATYNQQLEALIAEYPDQWTWWHKRWRRRPGVDYSDGSVYSLRTTKNYIAWVETQTKRRLQELHLERARAEQTSSFARVGIVPLLFCLLLSVASITTLSGCFLWNSESRDISHADRAAELQAEGKLSAAIGEYNQHMQQRLESKRRPESENPYFYQILIGDLYLKQGNAEEALKAFITAKERSVESALVADRLRSLALWYSDQGKHEQGIVLLREFRALDPLMFDFFIDRIHRKQVAAEEGQE